MALLEQHPWGVFNEHNQNITEASRPDLMILSKEFMRDPLLEAWPPAGLAASGIQSFPYADLIREHLSNGRILAAKNLLDFAKDLIPSESKLIKALAPPRIKRSGRRDVDRRAEFRWLSSNGAKYRGQWVALVGETLLASASTLADLLVMLKSSSPSSKPLIHHLD